MIYPTTRRMALASLMGLLALSNQAQSQYEAPATYYNSISNQTGATLKSQLVTIMTTGHAQSNYADAREYLPFTDANPANLTQMFEFYTHATIQKPAANSTGFIGIYDSREHVWPDSLQGSGNTSNTTRGSRGDIHMLKPLSQSINGSRGNNAFGGATLTGSARNIGNSQWFPGSTDKGDAARIIFYGATRWGSTLSVVNGNPTTNTQMGDLAALLRFHYQDAPDLFERRRNDVIYRGDDVQTSGDDISFAGTNNRNAYIDRPEYVWSVFVDQANDTQLSLSVSQGPTNTVDLGRVLRNAPVPAARSLTIQKQGVDGTYYAVTTSGAATSSITGRYNAFAMDATGSQAISIGLNTSTTNAGLKSGTVTVDNLDVTTAGGAGRGANDPNDVVNVQLSVLEPSNSSFASTADTNALSLDFGTYALGAPVISQTASVFNLAGSLGSSLTAGLDFDGYSGSGDVSRFVVSPPSFAALAPSTAQTLAAALTTTTVGEFNSSFVFNFSDENLPGTPSFSQLTLSLAGKVALGGDANTDGRVDFTDLLVLAQNYGASATRFEDGDFDRNGLVDFSDLLTLAQNYGGPAIIGHELVGELRTEWALAQSLVPEPTLCLVLAPLGARRRRR